MNGYDLITLLKDKSGWSDWHSYLEENAENNIGAIISKACDEGLKWGLLVLGFETAAEQYDAVERPAWEQYDAVERTAWEKYVADVRSARKSLLEAIEPRLREMVEAAR